MSSWFFLRKQSNKTKKERKKRKGEGSGEKEEKKTFLEFEGFSVSPCSWNNNHKWTKDKSKQRVRDDIKISIIIERIILALPETITDINNHNKTAAETTYLLFYKTHTPANISYLLISY